MTPGEHAKKLAEAKEKYGREFAHTINSPRITKPSIVLQDIERRARPAAMVLTVVNFKENKNK